LEDLSPPVMRRCGWISIFYMEGVRDTSVAFYTASIEAYRPGSTRCSTMLRSRSIATLKSG
jgi:hypothetical protein